MAKRDYLTVEFVACEKPRGRVVKSRKDGTLLVRYEMLQQELDAWIEKGIEEHLKKDGEHEQV